MDDDKGKVSKFIWRIENLSDFEDEFLESEIFTVDGIKWQIFILPEGSWGYDLTVQLVVAEDHPEERIEFAQVGLAVIDQYNRKRSYTKVQRINFKVSGCDSDTTACLDLYDYDDNGRGYLINDACVIEAYVSTCKTEGLVSHKSIVKSVLDGHKLKAYGSVEAEPVEFTTHSSSQSVDVESEEPTEKDTETFFVSIESECLCSSNNVVYSQEEAREAVAILDEALSPKEFYYLGKFFPLKKAFKILSTRTTLTIEQRNALLAMEERLKELADQAEKSLQYENELDEQVEETEKKKEDMLNEQKEISRSSKKMKTELVALQKECAEYEANAKVAKEEEKAVQAELKRMKDFISSIKGKI